MINEVYSSSLFSSGSKASSESKRSDAASFLAATDVELEMSAVVVNPVSQTALVVPAVSQTALEEGLGGHTSDHSL